MATAQQKSKLTKIVNEFVSARNEIARRGGATEASYDPTLKNLLERLAKALEVGVAVEYQPRPRHQTDAKKPDFKIASVETANTVGVLECKRPGAELNYRQVGKYKDISINGVLTDFYQFKRYRADTLMGEAELPERPTAREREGLVELLKRWLQAKPEKITDSEQLAELLAERCHNLRNELAEALPARASGLKGLLKEMQKAIYSTFDEARFADAIAQTFVFATLIAKLEAPEDSQIDSHNITKYIGRRFELIDEIVRLLPILGTSEHGRILKLMDEITAVVNGVDKVALTKEMSFKRRRHEGVDDDAYIYFYETFLAKYDQDLREQRGVYFTPPPVVKFIVRAIDDILKRDFKLKNGLTNQRVTALDFAAGTGTFLLEMMRLILEREKDATQRRALKKHLVENFYGFELLVAPYTMAHFKLSQYLNDMGIARERNERLKVYLANTLEDPQGQYNGLLPALTRESKGAQAVKSKRILVITGNPPYSGESQNQGAEARELIDAYKTVDGKPLAERNPKWLQDDYVKFIRFAQMKMDKADEGIVAVITNHAFLDNPTFRGMRQSLMQTFNRMYFLDLHGNAKKQEKNPDGGVDQNVFDIQQGVAISLFIKKRGMKRGVFHADLWGDRDFKYERCKKDRLRKVDWTPIQPAKSFYFFVPRDDKSAQEYEKLPSVNDIFDVNGVGIVTAHDDFVIDQSARALIDRFTKFRDAKRDAAALHRDFDVRKKKGWSILATHDSLQGESDMERFVTPIAHRPFDDKFIFYHDVAVWRTVSKVMRHMAPGDNIGLVAPRQARSSDSWRHCFITDKIMEACYMSNKGGEINYLYPLYVQPNGNGNGAGAGAGVNGNDGGVSFVQDALEKEYNGRRENFKPAFRKWIDDRYGLHYDPEAILSCIYAIMHSPQYRERYREFLRIDFPRVPFPKSTEVFTELSIAGRLLMRAHLLRDNFGDKVKMLGGGDDYTVGRVRYDEAERRLYFNMTKYLAPISPELAELQIGGYKPLEKYLKSRKGRDVFGDLERLQQIGNALQFTLAEIERLPDFL